MKNAHLNALLLIAMCFTLCTTRPHPGTFTRIEAPQQDVACPDSICRTIEIALSEYGREFNLRYNAAKQRQRSIEVVNPLDGSIYKIDSLNSN
jgi:hypothetical protein